MITERIRKTEEYMRQELMKLAGYQDNIVRMAEYRIEHSIRVAHIAAEIARAEGFDEERAYVAGLLHDIGYSVDFSTKEQYREHGRVGAAIARPFLLSLGFSAAETNEMCYGIAIHVDDKADFEGERTPLAETVGDADNIDRFDAFRLYEGLENVDFKNLPLKEQQAHAEQRIAGLQRLLEMNFGTKTATEMWRDRIAFQLEMYRRLKHQADISV